MDMPGLTNRNTLYAFEKVDLNYDRNDKVKISTLSTRVTNININGKNKKLVIFCRKDVATKNLESEIHRLDILKNEQSKTTKHLTKFLRSIKMNEKNINTMMKQIKTPHVVLGKYTEAELKIQSDAIYSQDGDLIDGKKLSNKEITELCQQAADIKKRKFIASEIVEFNSAETFEVLIKRSNIPQPTNIEEFMSKNNDDLKNKITDIDTKNINSNTTSAPLNQPSPLPKSAEKKELQLPPRTASPNWQSYKINNGKNTELKSNTANFFISTSKVPKNTENTKIPPSESFSVELPVSPTSNSINNDSTIKNANTHRSAREIAGAPSPPNQPKKIS